MAFKTPTHADGLIDSNDIHLIDTAVAGRTTDPLREVGAVIKVRVVRKLVDLDPLDRFVLLPAFADGLEAR